MPDTTTYSTPTIRPMIAGPTRIRRERDRPTRDRSVRRASHGRPARPVSGPPSPADPPAARNLVHRAKSTGSVRPSPPTARSTALARGCDHAHCFGPTRRPTSTEPPGRTPDQARLRHPPRPVVRAPAGLTIPAQAWWTNPAMFHVKQRSLSPGLTRAGWFWSSGPEPVPSPGGAPAPTRRPPARPARCGDRDAAGECPGAAGPRGSPRR